MRSLFFLAFSLGLTLPLSSCSTKKEVYLDSKPVIVETIKSASESWNGDSYEYPKGKAQITLQRITAQPGFKTPLHFHSQPGIAYLVKGNLTCGTINGKVLKVGPGESFSTPQNTVHYCESVGKESAVVFVTSAGVKGSELTIPYKK